MDQQKALIKNDKNSRGEKGWKWAWGRNWALPAIITSRVFPVIVGALGPLTMRKKFKLKLLILIL